MTTVQPSVILGLTDKEREIIMKLTKNYMDSLTVSSTVIEYIEYGEPTGLVSDALVYIDPVTGDDVIAEPYSIISGGAVHYYNRVLPEEYREQA